MKYKVAYDTTEIWYIPLTRYLSENKRWAYEHDASRTGWNPYCCRVIISDGIDEKIVRMVRNGVEVPIFNGEVLDLGKNWENSSFGIFSKDSLSSAKKQYYLANEVMGRGYDISTIYVKYHDTMFLIEYNKNVNEWATYLM